MILGAAAKSYDDVGAEHEHGADDKSDEHRNNRQATQAMLGDVDGWRQET